MQLIPYVHPRGQEGEGDKNILGGIGLIDLAEVGVLALDLDEGVILRFHGVLLWVVWLYYTMDMGELSRDGGFQQ